MPVHNTHLVVTQRRDGSRLVHENVNLQPPAALTGTSYGAAVELGDRPTMRATLDVSAIEADTTADVTVQTSKDGNTWYTSGTFTQATVPGSERKLFMLDRYVRAKIEVGGSGSATLRIDGECPCGGGGPHMGAAR
jgi:hypothetical protein